MSTPFPGPWKFTYFPWARDMHDSKAELNVGMKSAQAAFTETALNIVFYSIDVLQHDCLYVLPNKTPSATDFSASRFGAALELSEHLSQLFNEVDNVGHKRAGSTNLYIRGSNARDGLKSIPTPKIFLDELDEFCQENIELALHRSDGQKKEDKLTWMLSTPTVEKYGIHKYYLDSSQEHFFFPCPRCSKLIELSFPECLEITGDDVNHPDLKNTFLKCPSCKQKIDQEDKYVHLNKGQWVPSYQQRASRGFHVNQLYSSVKTPLDLAVAYLKSLKDPSAEQEFYNSNLGLPHVVKGARITDSDIAACVTDFKQYDQSSGGFCTMGVDVGKVLHVVINRWNIKRFPNTDLNTSCTPQVIKICTVNEFEDLDVLMHRYNVQMAIIDANPETRKSKNFCYQWNGRANMCYYLSSANGREILHKADEQIVSVNRTSWLDQTLHRFMNRTITLPVDVPDDYREQIKAQVKWYDVDKDGNPCARYRTVGENDHYGHAQNYAEIGLQLGLSVGVIQNMGRQV